MPPPATFCSISLREFLSWHVVRKRLESSGAYLPHRFIIFDYPDTPFTSIMSFLGGQIKVNLMAGLPTRTKSGGDYTGEKIPPCGEFVNSRNPRSILRPPWLPKSTSQETLQKSPRSVRCMRVSSHLHIQHLPQSTRRNHHVCEVHGANGSRESPSYRPGQALHRAHYFFQNERHCSTCWFLRDRPLPSYL